MQIAICDNEQNELLHIESLLKDYAIANRTKITVSSFLSPMDLLSQLEQGYQYDSFILDILLPTMNGIEAAKKIRQYTSSSTIIFLTSSTEFAVDSYAVNAFSYVLKPITSECFFPLMTRLTDQWKQQPKDCLFIQSAKELRKLSLPNLEYCEVYNKRLYYHMLDSSVFETSGRIADVAAQLSKRPEFHQVHRSYIINLEFVDNITRNTIFLQSGSKIPIPTGKSNEIKSVLLKYFNLTHENERIFLL